jgi:daunorubicin/doxorubicin transport system ATP-binding protein
VVPGAQTQALPETRAFQSGWGFPRAFRIGAGPGIGRPEGTPAQLKASVGSGSLHVRLLDPEQRPEAERLLAAELGTVHLEPDPAALSAPCSDGDRAAEAVAELARSDVRIAGFSLGQPSLDEVFLALTGHPAEDQTDDAVTAEEGRG